MSEEVSGRTVILLVTIALVVSVLSTMLVINAVYNTGSMPQNTVQMHDSLGRVYVSIKENPPVGVGTGIVKINVREEQVKK